MLLQTLEKLKKYILLIQINKLKLWNIYLLKVGGKFKYI